MCSRLMTLDVAVNGRDRFGFNMVKIMVVNGVVTNARSDEKFGVRHRLTAFL